MRRPGVGTHPQHDLNSLESVTALKVAAPDISEFNDLPVHERLSVLHLDEHWSELALPQVSKHALGRQ